MEKTKMAVGGEFLIKDTEAEDIFIPEEFDEEQLMIVQTCEDFLKTEIYPNLERIDNQEHGLMPELLRKAGELGLLGISVPEEYEGFGQSFLTTMRANESIGASYSYAVAFMAHTGIGTLPILYYGSEEQKQKYIPDLTSGDKTAAYCLTEPNAGSDANSGKSRAIPTEDGKHYIINGQKMWITNGGFADVLIVFAKVENDRVLSAFIVDSNMEGVTINPEEKKMGIKGSSTTQIFLEDVKVPIDNLLGKRGEGFRIALNILHIGRIKLGANVVGSCKSSINHSVNYANERKQFGTSISSFGAIKYKLSEQVIKTFASESATYRACSYVDVAIQSMLEDGASYGKANVDACAKYAVECALLKVFGSESLDYIVDEMAQIFGGMGFSAEAPADRAYRDSRINRIFEGTNEINRLLVIDTAIKAAKKGDFDLFGTAQTVVNELDNLPAVPANETYFEEKRRVVKNYKKAVLMLIQTMSDTLGRKLMSEQEIMMNVADMMMQLYAAESASLRVEKLSKTKSDEEIALYKDILDVFIFDAAGKIRRSGDEAICSYATEDQLEKLMEAMKYFTTVKPINVKEARRRIADKLIEDNRYTF